MVEIGVTELERIGARREAEVFALGRDRVLRLAQTAAYREEVERERLALLAVARCGAPAPAVFDRVDVDGCPGLVLERLDAHDLLHGLLRRRWEVALLPWVLARVHASLHETLAPTELPQLRAEVAARPRSELVPSELREAALRALATLPDGERLCHGDFHPSNLLRRRDSAYAAIDWKAAARCEPAADVARTRLLVIGAWIPGAGPRGPQLLLTPLRAALYGAYMWAYRRRRPVERSAVAAWVPVLAAARLSYDIAEERASLLALARRGLRQHLA